VFLLLLIVLCWYTGWFVGLKFKRQLIESPYGKIVTVIERVLFCYCYWLCWVDIAVGLLVWCLKINRMNHFKVKVWELLRGFCVSIFINCVCFDKAVGLLVSCLKDNRMNRLTVKVWNLLRGICVSTVIGCVVLI